MTVKYETKEADLFYCKKYINIVHLILTSNISDLTHSVQSKKWTKDAWNSVGLIIFFK